MGGIHTEAVMDVKHVIVSGRMSEGAQPPEPGHAMPCKAGGMQRFHNSPSHRILDRAQDFNRRNFIWISCQNVLSHTTTS